MVQNNSKQKQPSFLAKYGYFVAIGLGVVAFTVVLIIASLTRSEQPPPVDTRMSFGMPVLDATIYKDFSDTKLQYNATLNKWEAHKGLTFLSSSNTNVYAALDGVVEKIYTNHLEGTVVEISHGNGLKTSYGSLSEDGLNVEVGTSVTKGDVIGVASESACREIGVGAKVHFIVLENGKKIDPAGYLNVELK